MNHPKLTTARHLLVLAIALMIPLGAWADPASIGLINLTGGITAYNGTGINIGEIDINPGVADSGNPALSGQIALTTNLTLNTSGTLDPHATEVAGVMVSTGPTSLGVATGAKVYSVEVNGPIGGTLRTNTVNAAFWLATVPNTPVINLSMTTGGSPTDGSDYASRGLDRLVIERGTIFVKSAGNSGGVNTITEPGGAYNIITVGAVNNAGTAVADFSSQGYLANGRSKPDIVAPGENITMPTTPTGTAQASGTSFAAPHVSAVAARLVQAARSGAFPGSSADAQDPRVMKAVLLNSATKLAGWSQQGPAGAVQGGLSAGGTTYVSQPLDPAQGAGLLNAGGAYDQLAAGEHGATIFGATIHSGGPLGAGTDPLKGWALEGVTFNFENLYRFNSQAGGQFTATLNWYRDVASGTYADLGLVDLDLSLYSSSDPTFANPTLLAESQSSVDNVEHLFCTNLPPAYYEVGVEYVDRSGSALKPDSENYGLAWAIPEPSTPVLAGLAMGIVAGWRLFRRPSRPS